MTERKPRAWMRRWAYEGIKPYREKNERGYMAIAKKFTWLPVTEAKLFDDDVPLYSKEDLDG